MMNTNSSIARLLATVRRDVGLWVARCTPRRDAGVLQIAEAKRAMERGLRKQGTPRNLARIIVAEQFRRHELKGH